MCHMGDLYIESLQRIPNDIHNLFTNKESGRHELAGLASKVKGVALLVVSALAGFAFSPILAPVAAIAGLVLSHDFVVMGADLRSAIEEKRDAQERVAAGKVCWLYCDFSAENHQKIVLAHTWLFSHIV